MNLDKTKRLIMKPDKYQLDAIKSTKNTLLIAGAGAGKTFTNCWKNQIFSKWNWDKTGRNTCHFIY